MGDETSPASTELHLPQIETAAIDSIMYLLHQLPFLTFCPVAHNLDRLYVVTVPREKKYRATTIYSHQMAL